MLSRTPKIECKGDAKVAKLDGKVAVITGAADGIGEASARLFVREGARVVIADIDDEKGQAVAKELGKKVVYLHTDVTREADIKAAIDLAVKDFGRLDCIYNNAGGAGVFAPIQDVPVDSFDKTRLREHNQHCQHFRLADGRL
jgi:NAD(P)-dependent dehydrogenase (short-subunit alcohol dehydrogenase family)